MSWDNSARWTLRTHLFTRDPDVPPDQSGHTWCTCGLRDDHPAHQLPDRADDTARIIGERKD